MDELNTWRRSGELSDLTIQIDDSEFNLHKFPMFIKSDYLKKKISECNDNKAVLKLSNFPGGKEIFEIVSEFCYGERSSLNQENVVQTRCAAHLLEMETTGNLASFCDRVIDDLLRNAKNSRSTSVSIEMLTVCEQVGDISDKAGIVDRCVSALVDVLSISGRQQVIETLAGLSSNWFEKLLEAARKKNMRPHIIGEMLISYLQISFVFQKDESEEATDSKQRVELADEERQHLLDDVLLKVFRDENKVGEKHALQERLNPELAVKLLSEAERLKCDVKDDLRRLCAKLVPRLKAPDLAQLPPEVVVEMVQVGETDSANKEAACRTADIYLKALADNKRLDAETFAAVLNAAPNDARTNHDNLFEVLHTLLQSEESTISEEERDKLISSLDLERCSESTLAKIHQTKLIPTDSVATAALKLCAKLRKELDTAQTVIGAQDQQLRRFGHLSNGSGHLERTPSLSSKTSNFGDGLDDSSVSGSYHDLSVENPYRSFYKPTYPFKKSPTLNRSKYTSYR